MGFSIRARPRCSSSIGRATARQVDNHQLLLLLCGVRRFDCRDALLCFLQVLTLYELFDNSLIVGERLGLALDLHVRFGEVEIDFVALGIFRILLEHGREAIDRAWIPSLPEEEEPPQEAGTLA